MEILLRVASVLLLSLGLWRGLDLGGAFSFLRDSTDFKASCKRCDVMGTDLRKAWTQYQELDPSLMQLDHCLLFGSRAAYERCQGQFQKQ
jgi:hypothetical protein